MPSSKTRKVPSTSVHTYEPGKKHCQRNNGPKGWVLVTKVTSLGHFTSSQKILIIFHLHNLDQAATSTKISAFWLNLNFKIRRSIRISTKNNLHNLNQRSAAEYWLNFSCKISPELQLQTLDQPLCLDKNLILWANFSFQICTKLSSTRF